MHGLHILLAIAAFALGSAASATLPTSGAGDPQQAEYAPDTTTDPLSAASDFTGTYIHVLGLSNAKTKQNLIFKLKQKQKASENRNVKQKSNSKIGSMKRVCCLSLSFAKVAIGNGIGNVCLPASLPGVQPPVEADKYANSLWCVRRQQPIAQLLSSKLRKYSRINICLICRYYTKQDSTAPIWIRPELSPYRR